MSGEDVKAHAGVAEATATAPDPSPGVAANADVAAATAEAPEPETELTATLRGRGGKRVGARTLGKGGRRSERETRIAAARTEVARRKRDGRTTALAYVAGSVVQDPRHLRDDVHQAGWPDWRLFVEEIAPAD